MNKSLCTTVGMLWDENIDSRNMIKMITVMIDFLALQCKHCLMALVRNTQLVLITITFISAKQNYT